MSKYIKLKQDFGIDREKQKDIPDDEELTVSWIRTAVVSGYPQLKSDQRRIMITLFSKLEEAADKKEAYVEVNQFEYAFLKQGFDNSVARPEIALSITIAEGAVLNATDELPITPLTPGQPVGTENPEATAPSNEGPSQPTAPVEQSH